MKLKKLPFQKNIIKKRILSNLRNIRLLNKILLDLDLSIPVNYCMFFVKLKKCCYLSV